MDTRSPGPQRHRAYSPQSNVVTRRPPIAASSARAAPGSAAHGPSTEMHRADDPVTKRDAMRATATTLTAADGDVSIRSVIGRNGQRPAAHDASSTVAPATKNGVTRSTRKER